jgi:hypothetical protein
MGIGAEMTVEELMYLLEELDPEATVRLAIQPSWPFEHSLDGNYAEVEKDGKKVVYLAEGNQLGYLPGEARQQLGW